MRIEDFLSRLKGVRKSGAGCAARCPAHEDRHASLTVREAEDGKILVNCHAGDNGRGCSHEAITAALGLTPGDLFAEHDGARQARQREQRIARLYPYVAETEDLLFEVVRFDPKGFRQRRPDGKDGWIWNLDGVRRVLYRLPRLLETAKARGVVYVVEGEKDAEALERLGLVATCNAGGAGKWRPEYAETLRSIKGAVILPDNDPPGRAHARDVARSLHAAGIPVKVLELPNLREKGDVSDWLAAGGTRARLLELQKGAPLWGPETVDLGDTNPEDWPAPLPLRSIDVPPFPVAALPGDLRAYVEGVSVATQTPADLAALVTLAVVATAAAKRTVVEVREGWREPLNLFAAVVLGPGNRKSAVFQEATSPLAEFQAEEARRLDHDVKRSASRRKVAEKALEHAQAEAAKATEGAGTEKLAAVDRLVAELAALPVVTLPRLWADDVTPEKLAVLMAENGERMAVLSAEGGIFGMLAGRYQASGGPNLDVFLKGHAGDALAVDRVGRDALRLDAPALSVGLAVQPDVLRALADTPEFRGRGLLARFLFALPTSRVGARDLDPPPVPDDVRRRYAAIVRALLELEPARNGDGEPMPHVLTLSAGAASALRGLSEWLEPQLGEAGELGLMVDWAAKLAGAVARIAGLLHLAEHASERRPLAVSAETMDRAVTIGRYLIPHARAAFAQMGADSLIEDAAHLLGWLRRNRPATVTRRDLFNGTRGRFKSVEKLDRPLEMLEAHGFVRALPLPDSSGPGRPPSPSYNVNPATYAQNPRNTQNPPSVMNSADIADCAGLRQAEPVALETGSL